MATAPIKTKRKGIWVAIRAASDRAIAAFKSHVASALGPKRYVATPNKRHGIGGNSQTCVCGAAVPKTLSERTHHCPACGLTAPRDMVSANIAQMIAFGSVSADAMSRKPSNRRQCRVEAPAFRPGRMSRQAKRLPHEVRLADALATTGFFVRPEIKRWLANEVGDGQCGWVLCDGFVAFRFREEADAARFATVFSFAPITEAVVPSLGR